MRSKLLFFRAIAVSVLLLFMGAATVHAQVYCTPQFLLGCNFIGTDNDDINTFVLPGENGTAISDYNTGCSTAGYDDRSAEIVKMQQGGTYIISVNSSVAFSDIQIYADLNGDGSFGVDEIMGGMNAIAQTPGLSTISITIPPTTPNGSYRLRAIVSGDNNYPEIAPCGDLFYISGEAHDYTLLIGSTCEAVTSLAVSNVGSTSASADWDAQPGTPGYEYVVDNSPFDPFVSGTPVTTNHADLSGLTPSTAYYVHVRANCDASHNSTWLGKAFTTTASGGGACNPVSNLSVGVTGTAIIASWDAVGGATGYEYVVDQSQFDPTAPGTAAVANTADLTNFVSGGGDYYVHVRTNCGGQFSGWTGKLFSPAILLGVSNVTNANFSLSAYPNPASDKVSVKMEGKQPGMISLELTDITGKVLETVNTTSNTVVFDLHSLPNGIYLVKYTDDLNRKTIKISKQ